MAKKRSSQPKPKWIEFPELQQEWNSRFLQLLKENAGSDPAISEILRNEKTSQMCAVKVRSYVDKKLTDLYRLRKERGKRRTRTTEAGDRRLKGRNGKLCRGQVRQLLAILRQTAIARTAVLALFDFETTSAHGAPENKEYPLEFRARDQIRAPVAVAPNPWVFFVDFSRLSPASFWFDPKWLGDQRRLG